MDLVYCLLTSPDYLIDVTLPAPAVTTPLIAGVPAISHCLGIVPAIVVWFPAIVRKFTGVPAPLGHSQSVLFLSARKR